MKKFFGLIFPAVLFLFAFSHVRTGASLFAAEAPPLKKITFVTEWLPQAQFAGFYAARKKGIYKKYGLEVTILHGGPSRSPFDLLEKGQADIAMMWLASAIEHRARGVPLVNITQLSQKSALMLVARKENGIREPKDLDGKKVGLWDEVYRVQPMAFFEKFGIRPRIVSQSYSVNLFLRGAVDVASAMWFNEYHTILASGVDADELTTFFFSDYGLNFPEDGIYVFENFLAKDPELCAAFVKASLEGWQYAFDHPDEVLEAVLRTMKEAHVPANLTHQKWMLARMKDLMLPRDGARALGFLDPADYGRTAEALKKGGLITEIPEYGVFCRTGGTSDEK